MGFSSFRDSMDIWDQFILEDEIDTKVNSIIDGQGFIMFFEKEGEIYGVGEDGRLVFAKMKNPDDETPKGWDKEASFSAFNINKLIRGEQAQHLFKKEDLKQIHIIDREKATEALNKVAKKVGPKAFPKMGGIRILKISPIGDSPSFPRTDEE